MADFNNTGALFQNFLSNPTSATMNQDAFGSIAPPNLDGGISSLGGVGYQAYMVPGGISVPKKKPVTAVGALSGQSPAPVTAAQGTPVIKPEEKSIFQKMNESSAAQWNKTTGGTGSDDKRGFFERMNSKSKDQWENFTGTGKYDTSNGQKAPANAMGFEDKLNAGFGLASSIMNAFDRR